MAKPRLCTQAPVVGFESLQGWSYASRLSTGPGVGAGLLGPPYVGTSFLDEDAAHKRASVQPVLWSRMTPGCSSLAGALAAAHWVSEPNSIF